MTNEERSLAELLIRTAEAHVRPTKVPDGHISVVVHNVETHFIRACHLQTPDNDRDILAKMYEAAEAKNSEELLFTFMRELFFATDPNDEEWIYDVYGAAFAVVHHFGQRFEKVRASGTPHIVLRYTEEGFLYEEPFFIGISHLPGSEKQ
jgi:hypothetical protein